MHPQPLHVKISKNVMGLLVSWARPNDVFPRLPAGRPQARGESSTHEALSMLHSQKVVLQ